MPLLLEIAVDSIDDAIAAAQAGANRLELVSDLARHGLTPTADLCREVKSSVRIPVMAMIRPAHDESVVTPAIKDRMFDAAERLIAVGADGLVFGAITPDTRIDRDAVAYLVRLASPRQTVFHRAFDLIPDPFEAIDALADLGVTRILTGGMNPRETRSALALDEPISSPADSTIGSPTRSHLTPPVQVSPSTPPDDLSPRLERLRRLVEHARGRIEILPAGGVRPENVRRFIDRTGATQIHSSARRAADARLDPEIVRSLRFELDRR